MDKVLETKYGRAKIDNKGYYRITTSKEGNVGRGLHCLIWEDYHGKQIPEGYDIHHIDHNPLNNNISNLELMTRPEHLSHHHKDKIITEEARRKMSDSHKGKPGYWKDKHLSEEHRKKLSEAHKGKINPCLYIRKRYNKNYKQGFTWIAYRSNHTGELPPLQSINLNKCIQKVIEFINSPLNSYGYTDYKVIYN